MDKSEFEWHELAYKRTTTDAELQPFLEELKARQFRFQLDRNNKLALQRKLPADLTPAPTELIPGPVLRLLEAHREGRLSKESVGVVRFHDNVKLLRRYGVVEPPRRLSTMEKRRRSREYLRKWRKAHS